MVSFPTEDPLDNITRLKHISGNTFKRIRDDDELGEEIVFELGADGVVRPAGAVTAEAAAGVRNQTLAQHVQDGLLRDAQPRMWVGRWLTDRRGPGRSAGARFCLGEIKQLPWCDTPVRGETSRITEALVKMNRQGLLTINSQPQVSGASSTAPDVGWGGAGGFVYQKAYVEFFVAPEQLERLLACLEEFPSLTYHAVNVASEGHSNCPEDHINAVTWGVFPGREIVQPTVVDSTSFLIWKDEAFQLWLDEWASLYEADSTPHRVIREIRESYYLMNVVENNFIDGDIFRLFERLYNIPRVGRI